MNESLKTVNHHREGLYTSFKHILTAFTEMVQWKENLLLVLTDSEGPGSNPLEAHLSQHCFFSFFYNLFFTLFFTCVVHIASDKM